MIYLRKIGGDYDRRKEKSGSVVVTIFLILIIIGLIVYICYDKGIILKQENKKNSEETKEEVEKEEELDIHSVFVQELYNKVANESDEISRYVFTPYLYDGHDFLEDFTSNGGSEIIKMKLVRKNLRKGDEKIVDCSKVPDTLESDPSFSSLCAISKEKSFSNVVGYKKEEVEQAYKDLFGQDSNLDTSIAMLDDTTPFDLDRYVYISTLDMYVEYMKEGGGIGPYGGFKTNISKAIKKGKEIKIYETVEEYETKDNSTESLGITDAFTFVYTFEQESAGNYKFVSRIKEKA